MSPLFNIGGVASGFDWNNILDKLMEIERQPIVRIQQQQQAFQSKIKIWQSVNSQLSGLQDAADALRGSEAFDLYSSSLSSSSSVDAANILSATMDSSATAGSYDITVNQTAQKQKISSQTYTSKTAALGYSGQFLVNDHEVSISSSDSLTDIMNAINNLNSGTDPSEVSASVVSTASNEYRLILTSDTTGADGIRLQEAGAGTTLQDLGLVNSTATLQNKTSDGAKSSAFSDTNSAVGTVLGLSSPQSGTVTIGGQSIAIDLATDSLVDVANKINAAAGLTASVVSEQNSAGDTVYRVDVSGSTSFADSNNVLQTLGFLKNGLSEVQEVHTGDVANTQTTAAGGGAITAATLFSGINTGSDTNNVTNGDTLTISGTDHSGNAVSSTFTITDKTTATVDDLLTSVETAFGGAANVDAYISDGTDGYTAGTMVVKDLQGGESSMAVSITSNNEGGGTLNFGDMTAAVQGYSMEAQAGRDAALTIDGMTITRSSNTVSDAIQGVTLDLLSAEPSTTVTLSVAKDSEGIKGLVNDFINGYNTVMGSINQQFSYSDDKGTGGVLFGDGTLRSVQSDLRDVLLKQMDSTSQYSTLASIGVHVDKNGLLELNEAELDTAMSEDMNAVERVFEGVGTVSASGLEYVRHTSDTQPGAYDVNITQVATKASVTGTADLSGGLTSSQNISVTAAGSTAALTFSAGTSIDSIVAALNSEFGNSYQQTLTEGSTHTDSSTGSAMTSGTTWNNVSGAGVSNGDTITISGTNHSGGAVSATYTINDTTTDTVGDFLSTIENAFGGNVTASVTSSGGIQIKDDRTGTSSIAASLTYNGGGGLSFGAMSETTTGRYAVPVTASKSASNELVLTYARYGNESFSVTADAEFGITNGTYAGQDIAGTINGEAATGSGQSLKADSGTTADGLRINYTGTSTGSVGSVTVSYGTAEMMYQRLDNLLDPIDGYVNNKIDSLQNRIRESDKDITKKEALVELKRKNMFNRFVAMEMAISGMNAQGDWLNSQLSGLSSFL